MANAVVRIDYFMAWLQAPPRVKRTTDTSTTFLLHSLRRDPRVIRQICMQIDTRLNGTTIGHRLALLLRSNEQTNEPSGPSDESRKMLTARHISNSTRETTQPSLAIRFIECPSRRNWQQVEQSTSDWCRMHSSYATFELRMYDKSASLAFSSLLWDRNSLRGFSRLDPLTFASIWWPIAVYKM